MSNDRVSEIENDHFDLDHHDHRSRGAPIQGTVVIRDGAYETRDFFLLLIRTSYAYPLRRGDANTRKAVLAM